MDLWFIFFDWVDYLRYWNMFLWIGISLPYGPWFEESVPKNHFHETGPTHVQPLKSPNLKEKDTNEPIVKEIWEFGAPRGTMSWPRRD